MQSEAPPLREPVYQKEGSFSPIYFNTLIIYKRRDSIFFNKTIWPLLYIAVWVNHSHQRFIFNHWCPSCVSVSQLLRRHRTKQVDEMKIHLGWVSLLNDVDETAAGVVALGLNREPLCVSAQMKLLLICQRTLVGVCTVCWHAAQRHKDYNTSNPWYSHFSKLCVWTLMMLTMVTACAAGLKCYITRGLCTVCETDPGELFHCR